MTRHRPGRLRTLPRRTDGDHDVARAAHAGGAQGVGLRQSYLRVRGCVRMLAHAPESGVRAAQEHHRRPETEKRGKLLNFRLCWKHYVLWLERLGIIRNAVTEPA